MLRGMLALLVSAVVSGLCRDCNKNTACAQSCRLDRDSQHCRDDCGECFRCWPPLHTISGISSGGSMAALHSVVYSASCEGCGVVAGSPYGCNTLHDKKRTCGTPQKEFNWTAAGEQMQQYLLQRDADNYIDPVGHLAARPYWLFSGTEDTVVYTNVMKACNAQYKANGGSPAVEFSIPSEHAWVVNDTRGAACNHLGPPYLNNCEYDMSGTMLHHIKGPLKPPAHEASLPNLTTVDIRPYVPSGAEQLMSPCAYVFVPTACKHSIAACSIHVHYHGCGAIGRAPWGTPMTWAYGSLETIAEANNMVVIYPQSASTAWNPSSCWNWWGEGDPDFDTQDGAQFASVAGLLGDLENALKIPAPPERLCPQYQP